MLPAKFTANSAWRGFFHHRLAASTVCDTHPVPDVRQTIHHGLVIAQNSLEGFLLVLDGEQIPLIDPLANLSPAVSALRESLA